MAKEKMEQFEKGAYGKARPVVGVYWSVPPNERKERVWLVRVNLQKGKKNRLWVAENIYKKMKH